MKIKSIKEKTGKLIHNQRLLFDDYYNLAKNSEMLKITKKNYDDHSKKRIFSDVVTRINSKMVRKIRLILITGKFYN